MHAHIIPRHHTNYELVPTQEYYERDIWKTIEEVILEAQWAEPVSLTILSALKKLNTEPSTKFRFNWQNSFREEDF